MAARRACEGENTRVTFVLMPSLKRVFVALSPSSVMGILTTMFSCISASALPSFISPSASMLTASALTGPFTIEQISLMISSNWRPSLATSDGLVVTPSTRPHSDAFLISSTFAVSIKNFMKNSLD